MYNIRIFEKWYYMGKIIIKQFEDLCVWRFWFSFSSYATIKWDLKIPVCCHLQKTSGACQVCSTLNLRLNHMTSWCLNTKKSLGFFKYLRERCSADDPNVPLLPWKAVPEFPYFVSMQHKALYLLHQVHCTSASCFYAMLAYTNKWCALSGFTLIDPCSFNSEIAKYQGTSIDSIYPITCSKGIPSKSTFQNENVKVQRSYLNREFLKFSI